MLVKKKQLFFFAHVNIQKQGKSLSMGHSTRGKGGGSKNSFKAVKTSAWLVCNGER